MADGFTPEERAAKVAAQKEAEQSGQPVTLSDPGKVSSKAEKLAYGMAAAEEARRRNALVKAAAKELIESGKEKSSAKAYREAAQAVLSKLPKIDHSKAP